MITTIIFDAVGVILNDNPDKTKEAFINLGAAKEKVEALFSDARFLDKYNQGLITTKGFRTEVKKRFDLNISDEIFDRAFSAELLEVDQSDLQAKLDYILSFKKDGFGIFLLSNMNEIGYHATRKIIKEQNCDAAFELCFGYMHGKQHEYYSFLTHKIKPNANAYLQVTIGNKTFPQQAVMVGNSKSNVEGAEKAKLYGFLLEGKLIESNLREYINSINKKFSAELLEEITYLPLSSL